MTQRHFDYSDGWHPTVNPSARMAVHHCRFVEVLGTHAGVLNETPRRRGGSTLRLVRFPRPGHLHVRELPSALQWAPWWLPSTDGWAAGLIAGVYLRALSEAQPNAAERSVLGRIVEEFRAVCAAPGERTVGEALYEVTDRLQRDLLPGLPRVRLLSLTRSPARLVLADALAALPGGLLPLLGRWAHEEGQPVWGMLGVGTGRDGRPLRIRFLADRARLETEPLVCEDLPAQQRPRPRPTPLSEQELDEMLRAGRMIPGSRLTALAEASLHAQEWKVRHFGNTYGRVHAAARLLDAPGAEQVPCCPDDADSWHWADLSRKADRLGDGYPLHLLDTAACGPDARAGIPGLVAASLRHRRPVHLTPKESLDASLSAGRPGLFREEDHRPTGGGEAA